MECSEVQPNLMDYSLGRLTRSESKQVHEHLKVCGECKIVLKEEQSLCSRFSELDQVAPRNDMWTLIRSQARSRITVWTLLRTRTAKLATAAVATAAVVLTLVSMQPEQARTARDNDSIRAVTAIMTTLQQHEVNLDDPLRNNTDALAAAIEEGT